MSQSFFLQYSCFLLYTTRFNSCCTVNLMKSIYTEMNSVQYQFSLKGYMFCTLMLRLITAKSLFLTIFNLYSLNKSFLIKLQKSVDSKITYFVLSGTQQFSLYQVSPWSALRHENVEPSWGAPETREIVFLLATCLQQILILLLNESREGSQLTAAKIRIIPGCILSVLKQVTAKWVSSST